MLPDYRFGSLYKKVVAAVALCYNQFCKLELAAGGAKDGTDAQECCHWEDRNYRHFYPYPIASEYKGFFEALVCEDGFDEAMFDEDLLNEENWFVRENGNSKGISCPAIYDNCQIGFRYR